MIQKADVADELIDELMKKEILKKTKLLTRKALPIIKELFRYSPGDIIYEEETHSIGRIEDFAVTFNESGGFLNPIYFVTRYPSNQKIWIERDKLQKKTSIAIPESLMNEVAKTKKTVEELNNHVNYLSLVIKEIKDKKMKGKGKGKGKGC